ncbi:LacI family transcriptional regulator [Pseudonocardia autotrophica]|uniref:Ribose operon repressor n=3 Tax=Pseudonocardiaceae TaxID=2070 RepID=A0A1Y2MLX6_PSEAH|nr:Ribose operon repressor [Pseudonocardia autotrophica]TDN73048.1 LacI family transcriptional regulator [Pseudonocardia autotrophica]BBG03766.1 LacI family transcriptional regulator [Pseudonocardia autotrophica]GEC26626.1 LacI family transcriptional regulator [Pseudonocardia saturnea]
MATMAEVAARAGVSTATVSRVLAGKPVRPDSAEAVRAAAAALDYELDRTARSLRRRYSDLLALVVPDVENPFFTAVARGVEDTARRAGLSVVLCNSDDDVQKESRYLAIAASENMAGAIVAPAASDLSLGGLARKRATVVVIDRSIEADVDQVGFDNVALGREATHRLIARGCRRIACISGPRGMGTARDREIGWRAALTESGLDASPEFLRHANFRVDGGRRATEDLLRVTPWPDAVLATNNMVAIGALQAMAAAPGGATRPEVAVIGDLPFATTDVSGLVQVPLRPRELGIRAAEMFLERLEGFRGAARRVVLDGAGAAPPG